MTVRLTADLWVRAHIRRCELSGLPAYVLRRGDPSAGVIFLKIARLDGTALVLQQTTAADGARAFRWAKGPAPVPEAEADEYLARQHQYDPDLWIVEIEDRNERHALDEPLLPG